GFDPSNVYSFHLSISWAETNGPKSPERLQLILDGLRSIPGASNSASTVVLPGAPVDYQVEFKTMEGGGDVDRKIVGQSRYATASYFETMRLPLVAGQMCPEHSNTPALVVNNLFARTYFNGQDVIGRHFTEPANPYIQPGVVTGIVADARERGMHLDPVPTVYWCGNPLQPQTYLLVRAQGDPGMIMSPIRQKIHELEPSRSVYELSPLRNLIGESYAQTRLRTVLLSFFAFTAISLACIGLYGTLSYLVNLRRKEIGVRMALGAKRTQIVRQFLSQGLRIALIGCVAGLALAAAAVKLLSGMLFGVTAADPLNLSGTVFLVIGVSALASLIPAVRAARLEPVRALRDE